MLPDQVVGRAVRGVRQRARPQAVVPTHAWQAAETTGPWTLVGCTMWPAFTFDGFELAPPGWSPR
jgi:predicted cupin superfamily sugar epimerase